MTVQSRSQKTLNFYGYPLNCGSYADILTQCYTLMKTPGFHRVLTLNPIIFMNAKTNQLEDWLQKADLVIPDGVGITWAAKRFNKRLSVRTGIQITLNLLEKGGFRLALIGSTPERIQSAAIQIKHRFPKTELVTFSHGYLKDQEKTDLLNTLKDTQPDLILVGMGFPKQEQFIQLLDQHLSHGLAIGVGGVIDVLSGSVRWAPTWIRTLKCEWLFRLLTSPKRLQFLPTLIRYVWRVGVKG